MIIAEYFQLPTTDTLYRFIYRFIIGGMKTAWQSDFISSFSTNPSLEDSLKMFILDKYRRAVVECIPKSEVEVPDSIFNMLKESSVKLIECDISPKKDPDGYMKEIV